MSCWEAPVFQKKCVYNHVFFFSLGILSLDLLVTWRTNKQTNNNQGFETKMTKYQWAVNTIAHSNITWAKSTFKSLEIIYLGHCDS